MYRHYPLTRFLGADEVAVQVDRIWSNARIATLQSDLPGLGIVEGATVAARAGRIVFAGKDSDAASFDAAEREDCEGRWITPGLIDCHTHLIHGGNRAHEFELRLEGASYEEIARAGGGILSTMKATREASREALVETALLRLDTMIAQGLTTIEIKSGYGLSSQDEVKMLLAAGDLAERRAIDVARTFLGAHAVPPEYAGDADGYVALVCAEMIPFIAANGLAEAVDAFCEGIGFTPAQVARVMATARAHGLGTKIHAEQLSNLHGARLAAEQGALSADHLEHLDEASAEAMARAGTVAVLLPGAYYFTREERRPPVDLLRRLGIPMAVATDCNPGTSPLTSPLLAMNMAATFFRLTVEECIAGMTREAARALGRLDRVGTIEAGKQCDLAIWNVERPAELVYRIGFNPLHARIQKGR